MVHRRLVIPASDRYVRELAAVLSDDSSWIEGAGHAEKSQWSALRGGIVSGTESVAGAISSAEGKQRGLLAG